MKPHRILMDYLISKGFRSAGDTLTVPEEYRHFFMGEPSIPLNNGTLGDFPLERVMHILETEGPSYYRLALPDVPEQLSSLASSGEALLGGCFMVQYEAHKLVEEIHCAVASNQSGVSVSLGDILSWVESSEPTKIYFRPKELESLLIMLRGAIKKSLASSVKDLRSEMAAQLEEELRRVEEYYRMLKGSVNSLEERSRYETEEQHLVSQYIRRLHPSSLKIRATPVVLFSMVFDE